MRCRLAAKAVFLGWGGAALVALSCVSSATPPTSLPIELAVLALASTEGRNEATAVESALETVGVPFAVTTELSRALRAPLVVVAGTLTNTTFSPADRERLYAYVEAGGVLVASHVRGNAFFPLFGLKGFATSRKNFRLRFADPHDDPALRYINRPEEQEIRFGNPDRYPEIFWTTEYTLAGADALGHFPNGKVALARHHYGRGVAYALGAAFSDATLLPMLGQSYQAEKDWANVFAPTADVVRLLLRGLYEATVHPFVLIHTVPDGQETALLLSHDIDARESFRHSVAFASLEQRFGVTSTFFVTTKYFTDATDIGYYDARNIPYLRQIRAQGFELGSHTVSHLKTFHSFPLGDPGVSFRSYRPRQAPTVYGEVTVSRELLERDIPGQHTISFRAGDLSHPRQLILALEETGYLVDSTRAAGNTLTNFAYRPLREAHLGSPLSNLIEIPVTLDDSMGYLTPDNVDQVVARWIDIIAANGENHAITCLLIHPTDVTYKLETEERLLQASADKSIWIGDLTRFGLFARQRVQTKITAYANGRQLLLRLNHPRATVPPGLTLVIESGLSGGSVRVEDSEAQRIPFTTLRRSDRNFLVLHPSS